MSARYPGYDVQHKQNGPSWNEATRRVIDARLAVPREPRFCDASEWCTLQALCARIVPQPANHAPVPQAWRLGLAALDAEARALHRRPFTKLDEATQDWLLGAMQRGELHHPAWSDTTAKLFFSERLVHNITAAYYSHPQAWNDIGFGGPASPRGYVRLAADQRDAWAAAQTGNHGLWGRALLEEMEKYNHQVGLKRVGETLPQASNRVTLADECDQYGLPVARVSFSYCANDKRLIEHAHAFMRRGLEAIDAREIWTEADGTAHLMGTARMGFDRDSSVVDADCRSWDIPNLWICDGSVFPTSGGINPSLTIQAIACRTADRIRQLAGRGELRTGS